MCSDCEIHRNLKRDTSIHAAGDTTVVIGTGVSRKMERKTKGKEVSGLKAEDVPE